MQPKETAERQVNGRPLLAPEGMVDLWHFKGELRDFIWELPDEEFVGWAEELATDEEENRGPVAFVYFQGKGEKLVTRDLGGVGVAVSTQSGTVLEAGRPYVANIIEEERIAGVPYKRLAVREPKAAEYIRYIVSEESPRIVQVALTQGREVGEVIGILPGGKVALIDRESRYRPSVDLTPGDSWIGEAILEKDRFVVFRPHIKAEHWQRKTVRLTKDGVVVSVCDFEGLNAGGTQETIRVGDDGELSISEALKTLDLPDEKQAILVRLYNIHLTREQARRREEAHFQEELRLARSEAWKAYKEGRVRINEQETQQSIDGDGRTAGLRAVVIEGDGGGGFEIPADHPAPARWAWSRYEGDRRAMVAAEALGIVSDDQVFTEYLREQEGMDMRLGELVQTRPQGGCLYVGNLRNTIERYRGESDDAVARDTFLNVVSHQVERRIIDSGVAHLELVFAPILYSGRPLKNPDGAHFGYRGSFAGLQSTGINPANIAMSDRGGPRERTLDSGLVGTNGKVYEVGYVLRDLEVSYSEGFNQLPENLQERIASILANCLIVFKEPALTEIDSTGTIEAVSWRRVVRNHSDGTQENGQENQR